MAFPLRDPPGFGAAVLFPPWGCSGRSYVQALRLSGERSRSSCVRRASAILLRMPDARRQAVSAPIRNRASRLIQRLCSHSIARVGRQWKATSIYVCCHLEATWKANVPSAHSNPAFPRPTCTTPNRTHRTTFPCWYWARRVRVAVHGMNCTLHEHRVAIITSLSGFSLALALAPPLADITHGLSIDASVQVRKVRWYTVLLRSIDRAGASVKVPSVPMLYF